MARFRHIDAYNHGYRTASELSEITDRYHCLGSAGCVAFTVLKPGNNS